MTVKDLISTLKKFPGDNVVICIDESGSWDNILKVEKHGATIEIVFGGGSPFSDE